MGAVYLRARLGRDAGVAEIAHRYRLPEAVLRPAFDQARAAGYLAGDDGHLRLTGTGQREIDGLIAAMQAWLSAELRDWGAEDDQLLREAMGNIARQIVEQDPFPARTPELTRGGTLTRPPSGRAGPRDAPGRRGGRSLGVRPGRTAAGPQAAHGGRGGRPQGARPARRAARRRTARVIRRQ